MPYLCPEPSVPMGVRQPAEQQHQFAPSSISQHSTDESVQHQESFHGMGVSQSKKGASLQLVLLCTMCLPFPQIALSPFHSPPALFICLPCLALAMEIVMISMQLIPFHTHLPSHAPKPFACFRSCWDGLGLSALFSGVLLGQIPWSSCNREVLLPTQHCCSICKENTVITNLFLPSLSSGKVFIRLQNL